MLNKSLVIKILFISISWIIYGNALYSAMKNWWKYLDFLNRNEVANISFKYENKKDFLTAYSKELVYVSFFFLVFLFSLLIFIGLID